ncbi:MAG: transposase [Candidatus Heimdallarchaeum endolithica]|uniref:Transposase n=1 Tax=Candidatus Heimdallarchaeum endolithica TaxID=2876572 RepID=A0A9Y1BNQ3_9ARCH|nr:MAG: transposase [Candidatus Heimdallarchaeum endolithica]
MKHCNFNLLKSVKSFLEKRFQPTREDRKTSIKVCHWIRKMDFPHKGQRKRGETKEEVKKTVLGAVVEQTSIEQSAEQFSTKDGDTIRYHLNKLDINSISEVFISSFQQCGELLKRKKKIKSPLILAVDTMDIRYYGKRRDEYIHQYKNEWFYRYITVSTVKSSYGALPLGAFPVSTFDSKEGLLESLFNKFSLKNKSIKVLYADRGFYSVEVVKLLQAYTIPFVIGARKNKKIRSYLETFPKTGKITSVPYTMKSGQGETTEVMLHAYWLPKRKDWFVCISWHISSEQQIYDYCHRWGIETSYRLLKSISVSTTTNNATVRFLYLCFSLLVSLYMSVFALLLSLLFSLPRLTNRS